MHKIKSTLLILGIVFYHSLTAGNLPLEISEIYSPNKIVELQQQKLILIDFWATWCGPCRPATKQLEILQQQAKNLVYMVSVTDETHETVAKYLEQMPIDLMVVRDFGGNLVRKFNVSRRPFAVVLNSKGNLVWKGHPSDLDYNTIKLLADKNKMLPAIGIDEIFKNKQEELKNSSEQAQTATVLAAKRAKSGGTKFLQNTSSVFYQGSLFKLIAKIYNVPNHMVKSERIQDFNIEFQSPLDVWNFQSDTVLNFLSQTFYFNIEPQTNVENVNFLEVADASKLWDITQIDWGENNVSNSLIGADRIQADNITIADLSTLLSNTKKQVYKYFGDDYERHDWDIHFRFDELMEDELLNQFGIRLQKKKLLVTYFMIE